VTGCTVGKSIGRPSKRAAISGIHAPRAFRFAVTERRTPRYVIRIPCAEAGSSGDRGDCADRASCDVLECEGWPVPDIRVPLSEPEGEPRGEPAPLTLSPSNGPVSLDGGVGI